VKLAITFNGSKLVPSNCSNLTELLPNKSNTNATESAAFSSTVATIFFMFSGDGVHPGTVTLENYYFLRQSACSVLTALASSISNSLEKIFFGAVF
jgi:hypothetical protein